MPRFNSQSREAFALLFDVAGRVHASVRLSEPGVGGFDALGVLSAAAPRLPSDGTLSG